MNLNISSAIMVRLFKMMTDVCLLFRVLGLDCIEMCLNPVHTPQLHLSHILHFTRFTCYAVNYVGAFTGYIFSGDITVVCKSAGNAARLVQNCTIFAIFGIAFITQFTI